MYTVLNPRMYIVKVYICLSTGTHTDEETFGNQPKAHISIGIGIFINNLQHCQQCGKKNSVIILHNRKQNQAGFPAFLLLYRRSYEEGEASMYRIRYVLYQKVCYNYHVYIEWFTAYQTVSSRSYSKKNVQQFSAYSQKI